MMITLEQVENLREYANVGYEEAKEALEACNGDLLEAVIYLEKQGKTVAPKNGGSYSTKAKADTNQEETKESDTGQSGGDALKEQMGKLWKAFCDLIHKGNINYFEVDRKGERMLSVPVNFLALALLLFFWITLPLLVIGLFFGCIYRFKGPDLGKDTINQVMESASETAENMKNAVSKDVDLVIIKDKEKE